ncbi:hypothetical protein [Saccharibacillus brassicae]|uniref:Uncharacterized protein n=1 Tax=Saccharibacillus brassicae TaxID=2583377 RepID=A0A4Y6UZ34_SACBS|nr:hypothetical protein [Saccharibacillus brassicae]QDH23003.1 hypothetical protein FFV09_20390 [Saccharibacillus brassicae]
MTTQSSWIKIEENGLHVLLEVTESGDVRLLHMGPDRAEAAQSWPEKKRSKFRLTEIQASGENHDDHHGSKHTGTLPAKRLTFGRLADRRHAQGRQLTVELSDPLTRLEVRCHLQFFDGLPAVRCWTEIFNPSDAEIGLEYVSSFACTGLLDDDSGRREEVVMNMVNTLLLRIHQSGHLAEISDDRFELIREAIAYYKTIRQDLKRGRPFWPLGLPTFGDGWMAFGMQGAERTYLAVWRMGGAESIGIPLERFGDNEVKFRQAYPNEADSAVEWDAALRELRVSLTHPASARLYELDL